MADFETEQLRTIMDNLADRLDKTQGDKASQTELSKIRSILERFGRDSARRENFDSDDFIKEFFETWKKEDPLRDLRKGGSKTGTIVNRESGRAAGTIIDRETKKFAATTSEMREDFRATGKEVKGFGSRLKETGAKAAGMATAVIATMKAMTLGRDDYYRNFLASGEGSIDSIQHMGEIAARSNLTLEQFTNAMIKGTDGARLIGAVQWGKLSAGIRDMTRATGGWGMTVDQWQEASQSYAELVRAQGLSLQLDTDTMTRGILDMVRNTSATASILGKNREDVLKQNEALAKDRQLMGILMSRGIKLEDASGLIQAVEATAGQSGKDIMYDMMTTGQVVSQGAATAMALDPNMGSSIADATRLLMSTGGGPEITRQSAEMLRVAAMRSRGDANGLNNLLLQSRFSQDGGIQSAATDALGFRIQAQNLKTDSDLNRVDRQGDTTDRQAGNAVLGVDQLAQSAAVTGEALITSLYNPVVNLVGPSLVGFNNYLISLLGSTNGFLIGLSKMTGLMGTLGVAVIGLTGIMGAVSMAGKAMGILRMLGAGGAAGGAARGLGGMLLKGGRFLGAGALGAAGMYGASSMMANNGGESLTGTGAGEGGFWTSKLASYALGAGSGAASGAMLGSMLGPIGTAVGGILGGGAGLLSTYLSDPGAAANASRAVNTSARPANGSRDASNRTGVAPEEMNRRIMEASEGAAQLLRAIKINGDTQVRLMREDLSQQAVLNTRLVNAIEGVALATRRNAAH